MGLFFITRDNTHFILIAFAVAFNFLSSLILPPSGIALLQSVNLHRSLSKLISLKSMSSVIRNGMFWLKFYLIQM